MKKIYILLIILSVGAQSVSAEISVHSREDAVRATFDAFSEGILDGDIDAVNKCVAPDFSLAEASFPRTNYYINYIINNSMIKSIALESVDTIVADVLYAKVLVTNKNNKVIRSVAALNAKNEILFIDYLDRLTGKSRYNKSSLVGSIPFELNPNNQIILTASVEGYSEPLKFLFDTGASGFAMTTQTARKINLPIAREESVSVVGGSMNAKFSSDVKVSLSEEIKTNQSFAIFDELGHPELDGIVGLSIAYSYIINIDFDNKIMSFYTMGNYPFSQEGTLFTTTVPSGTMHIDGSLDIIGGKEVQGDFIVDTGADYYLIGFNNFVHKNKLLESGFEIKHHNTTESLGKSTPIVFGNTKKFSLGNIITMFDMPIALQTDSEEYNDKYIEVDGSVGIHFISRFNITIDLLRKKIHLSPRKPQSYVKNADKY